MAQEENEELLVCWDNFNENLLTGFSESLFRGEFLDVTLAAEGHFIEAHRLILSVGSPFFQKMFTLMPSNQRAIGTINFKLSIFCSFFATIRQRRELLSVMCSLFSVFLKDVAYSTLKSLTQYLYCGEVNIEAGALPAFISAANALEIKGIVEETPPPAQPVRYEPKPAQSELAANVNDMVGYLQQQIQQQQALPLPQPKNNQKRFKQRYIGLESTESKRLKSIPKSKADDPELNSLPANVVPYESKPKPACSYTIGDVVQVTDLNEEVSHHGYYNGNEENDNSSYAEGIASGAG